MAYRQRGPDDRGDRGDRGEHWDFGEPAKPPHSSSHLSYLSDSVGENNEETRDRDMEPAGHAARVILQKQGKNEALLRVILQSSFRALRDDELVPIYPCPYCGDGGMRTVGAVRMPRGRAFVRACDTCPAVEVGERPVE